LGLSHVDVAVLEYDHLSLLGNAGNNHLARSRVNLLGNRRDDGDVLKLVVVGRRRAEIASADVKDVGRAGIDSNRGDVGLHED